VVAIDGADAVQQARRGVGGTGAGRQAAIGVDFTEFVGTQLRGHQHIANLLLLFVHAKGDADGDDGFRLPSTDGLACALLRRA